VESLLLPGLVLLVVGIARRKERWGKAFALAGAAGVVVALLAAGPEIDDPRQQGF
jgi:sugar phosphate permease